jgi:RNA-directed DNA polymerase
MDALAVGITCTKVNWILDADIRKFFDSVSHDWLIRFLDHRIGDPRVINLIRKWLKAGVMEDGVFHPTEEGTPQGALVSPLLTNVFRHYVFDLWVNHWRKHHARGHIIFVRYADDVVVGFERADDAHRFLVALRERLEKFSLTLHPDKTRLIECGRFAVVDQQERGLGKPKAFDFLGFAHICSHTRTGNFRLRRKIRRDRMRAKLQEIKAELRGRMHQSIPQRGLWLRQVVAGYFAYHAVPTYSGSICAFSYHVVNLWRRTLRRRTRWERVMQIANDWLPKPLVHHPWPGARFSAKHPRWEPSARIAPAGICAGGAQ